MTAGLPKVTPTPGESGTDVIPEGIEVREINGRRFLAHKVLEKDTLLRVSMKYNVAVNVIRQTN